MTLRASLNMNVFDAVVSSDLKRVTDTVGILLNGKDLPWTLSPLFREIDWGSITGMEIEQVNFKRLACDVETREMLYERAGDVATFLKEHYMGKCLLVVSHGLFLRSFIANLQ